MQALSLHRNGLLDQAIRAYEGILNDYPRHLSSRMNLGIVHFLRQDNDRALAAFEAVLEEDPDHADALYNYGKVLSATGRLTEALDAFERSLAQKPAELFTLQEVCRTYLALERLDEFFEMVARAIDLAPTEPGLYLLKAEAFLKQGDPGRASDLLQLLLRNDPTLTPALELLSECHRREQRTEKAIACLKRALLRTPNSPSLHKKLGDCYAVMGDFERARSSRARAQELDPTLAIPQAPLGSEDGAEEDARDAIRFQTYILSRSEYYGRTGNWRGAINEFLILRRKYPHRPIIIAELAAAYQAAGEPVRAYTLYREVLEREPHNLEVQLQLSRLALTIGRLAEAKKYSERSTALYPEVSEVNEVRGQILLAAGEDDQARRAFEQALLGSPGNLQALLGLANCHRRSGRFREARDVLEHALRVYPRCPHLALDLAECHAALGQPVAAIRCLREAREGPEPDPRILGRLATFYVEGGWAKKARLEYRALLRAARPSPSLAPMLMEAHLFFRQVREALRVERTYLKRVPPTPRTDFLLVVAHVMNHDPVKFSIPWQRLWRTHSSIFEQRANYLKAVLNRSDVAFLLGQMGRTQKLFRSCPDTIEQVTAFEDYLSRIQAIAPVTELSLHLRP